MSGAVSEPSRIDGHEMREYLASANGISICWESFGDAGDPSIVLIAGMGVQMIGWDAEFCQALAAQGFHVIRFDNRDVGRSSWLADAGTPDITAAMTRAYWRFPVKAPYLLNDMAADVTGLMDALGIDKAHVVGTSMGGTIAQTMAIHRPSRLLSVTSIMSTTGDPGLPSPDPSAVSAVFRPPARTRKAYVDQYVETYRILRAGRFAEEEARDRGRALRTYARGLNPAGGARHFVAILASGSRKRALRNVSIPTLVIHGALDPLVPLAAGIDTAKSIPGAELMVFEEMGHTLPMRLWPRLIEGIVGVAARAS